MYEVEQHDPRVIHPRDDELTPKYLEIMPLGTVILDKGGVPFEARTMDERLWWAGRDGWFSSDALIDERGVQAVFLP